MMPAMMSAVHTLVRSLARLVPALLFALALSSPGLADETADRAALDQLFAELRVAPDAETAHAIDQKIWTYWTTPSNTQLAQRMVDVMDARGMGNLKLAIDLLNQLVLDYPDYAEGWNQRATLYFMVGDYEASIADCGRVLELEPRHFGALSGRAMMYLQMGKRSLALRDMAAALAIHPFLNERRLFPELEQEITRA